MILGIGFDDPFTVGLLALGLMMVLIFLGVRVVFAAAVVGLFGLVELLGWGPAAGIVGTIPHSKSSTYALSVLPMFIFIGFLAFHAGMTQQLFDAARKWVGWVPGDCCCDNLCHCGFCRRLRGVNSHCRGLLPRCHPGNAEIRL